MQIWNLLTCSHAQNDQKSLKPLKIAIFTISVDFGVSQWWELYFKVSKNSHACETVSQQHSWQKLWPYNIWCAHNVRLKLAHARREYIGYSWFPVYFTQCFIATTNSTSKVGDV